jgi:hypothetical protein
MGQTLSSGLPPATRGRSSEIAGVFSHDPAEKKASWEAALTLYRELGDQVGIGRCINNLGYLARGAGDYQAAGPLFQESLKMAQASTDKLAPLTPLTNLALNALFQSDFAGARAYLDQHQAVVQAAGSVSGSAENKRLRGYVALRQGQPCRAQAAPGSA